MELIELILLKDNKHLGKKGRHFEADKPQADYLINSGIAALPGKVSVSEPAQELVNEAPEHVDEVVETVAGQTPAAKKVTAKTKSKAKNGK